MIDYSTFQRSARRTGCPQGHSVQRPLPFHHNRPDRPRRRWGWLGVLLLTGLLVFCHGCHGDEDNELFANLKTAIRAVMP